MSGEAEKGAGAVRLAHIYRTRDLLASLLKGARPADKVMDQFFRSHKEMGQRDRGIVAEAVYGCLRRLRSLAWALDLGEEWLALGKVGEDAPVAEIAGRLSVAWFARFGGQSLRGLERLGIPQFLLDGAEQAKDRARWELAPEAVKAELPDEVWEKLVASVGREEALAVSEALGGAAPVDLRANTLKGTREELLAKLVEEGFEGFELTPWSPVGLRRKARSTVFRSKAFEAGLFEVQDEGSQLLGVLVEAKPKERVVDFCAGSGGKTLELAAAMKNKGTLYAMDNAPWRLERMKPRLIRAGVDNVRMVAIDDERDPHARRMANTIDRVLVDAPCTGTGTLRRNPDMKWQPLRLAELVETQGKILAAAALLPKVGGRLVYATCSLLADENEGVVEAFLAANPNYKLLDAREIMAREGVPVELDGPYLRLWPHRHHTDGFFGAAMERVS
jgi:16S rRNA (cytosine967-C5)-methyltransferase